jgi:hypothetical protein
MRPPRKGKPFLCWTRSCAVPHSRPISATPLHVTAAKSLALDCDQRAARDAGWWHSARSASGSGLQLATRGSFPVAEHGGTIQSSPGLYIIVEGVSH